MGSRGKKSDLHQSKSFQLRHSNAKFNRETALLDKQSEQIEKSFRSDMKKIYTAQRAVVSMVGKDPYPDCKRNEMLFEFNSPGFCYLRNGEPRLHDSLFESKSRRIISNINGNEGFLAQPPNNVISDSPLMGEILSNPEIIQILCELRTTSVLMGNKELFQQFKETYLQKTNMNDSAWYGDAMEYLRHYRIASIRKFLNALKTEAESALTVERKSTKHKYDNIITEDSNSTINAINMANASRIQERNTNMATEESNTVQKLKARPDELRSTVSEPGEILDAMKIKRQLLGLAGVPTLYHNRSIGFEKYFRSSTNTLHQEASSNTPGRDAGKAVKDSTNPILTTTISSTKPTFPTTTSSIRMKQQRRKEKFHAIIRSLIVEVENIVKLGKCIDETLQRTSTTNEHLTAPLFRLLKKKSLFSSLNEDEPTYYGYNDVKEDVTNNLTKHLNPNLKLGGFTFKIPAKEEKMNDSVEKFGLKDMVGTEHELTRNNKSLCYISQTPKESIESSSESNKKSLPRVGCSACQAKVMSTCRMLQARNKQKKLPTTGTKKWRIAGTANLWINGENSRSDKQAKQLLNLIPFPLRQNCATNFTPFRVLSKQSLFKSAMGTSAANYPPQTISSATIPSLNSNKIKCRSNLPVSFNRNSTLQLNKENMTSRKMSTKLPTDSWTLEMSKIDIMKLQHELDTHVIRQKMDTFSRKYLKKPSDYNN